MSLTHRFEKVAQAVAAESALPSDARTTEATDAQLEFVADYLRHMIRSLNGVEQLGRNHEQHNLGYMITDSWNINAELSRELVEVEDLFLDPRRSSETS